MILFLEGRGVELPSSSMLKPKRSDLAGAKLAKALSAVSVLSRKYTMYHVDLH